MANLEQKAQISRLESKHEEGTRRHSLNNTISAKMRHSRRREDIIVPPPIITINSEAAVAKNPGTESCIALSSKKLGEPEGLRAEAPAFLKSPETLPKAECKLSHPGFVKGIYVLHENYAQAKNLSCGSQQKPERRGLVSSTRSTQQMSCHGHAEKQKEGSKHTFVAGEGP